jgi:3-dehydroquinate synthase
VIELRCAPAGLPPSRISIGTGARHLTAERARDGRSWFAIADRRVAELWPDALLPRAVGVELLPGGEGAKTVAVLERLLRAMARAGLDRDSGVLALGGGAVGDVAGLAAALYLRGIELVQVPTTLLAMADSSVGGKTAVDLLEGKNLAGAWWPASEVLVDPEFLRTLPDAEVHAGLAEVLKVAIGLDAELFGLCERGRPAILAREPGVIAAILERAIAAKVRIVEQDPRESGPRRLLNLGHTLGHALEAHSGYALSHGAAVGRGLFTALQVGVHLGVLDRAHATRAKALLEAYGFAADPLPPLDALWPFLVRDKKRTGNAVRFVVPTAIGRSEVRPLPLAELATILTTVAP